MRVLFVSPYVPSPIRVRPYQWIRALARHGLRVRLVALQPPEDAWLTEAPVADCCEAVKVFPLSRARTVMNAVSALPRDLPLQAVYSQHAEAEAYIAVEAQQCDLVHVEHLRGALLARRVAGVPRVLDAVDSITALFTRAASKAPSWRQRLLARLDLARTRRFEAAVPSRFDRTLVSSARDAAAFTELAARADSGRVVSLPNGVDLEYFRPATAAAGDDTILFSGKMSYHANEAAVLYLVREVMPLVWRAKPHARLVIAGKDPSAAVRTLGGEPRITVTGYVEDLRPFFRAATVVVAPLTYGTGIQNKVLEAMASGVPVVASPTACEGIAAPKGRALLIGATPREMATHIVSVMSDAGLREQLASAGRRYVEQHHDWHRLGRRLIDVYEDVLAAHRRCA